MFEVITQHLADQR